MIPVVGESDSDPDPDSGQPNKPDGDSIKLSLAPGPKELELFETFLEQSAKGPRESNSKNSFHPQTQSRKVSSRMYPEQTTSTRTSLTPEYQIEVQSPNSSPKFSPWISHTPRSEPDHPMERLSVPGSAFGPFPPVRWSDQGFFDQRGWCWWVGLICCTLFFLVSLYFLVTRIGRLVSGCESSPSANHALIRSYRELAPG